MGAAKSSSKDVMSPRTLKRHLSEFVLSPEQDSVVKSPNLYDNEITMSDDEGKFDHTPVSPYALSWAETTPSTATSFHCDADALKVLLGREDSITMSEVSISRAASSPTVELEISMSPRSDMMAEGFFPPTPRGCHTPRSQESRSTVCTPTDVRRLSATQNLEMDLQDGPKGVRLSRRGGMCAFYNNEVPEQIRSIRSELFDVGGSLCPEGENAPSHRRVHSARYHFTPRAIESISSEVISPHIRNLRRARTDYVASSSKRSSRRATFTNDHYFFRKNCGGSQIP